LTKKTFPQREKKRKEKKRREGWLTTKDFEKGGFWEFGKGGGGRGRGPTQT
jgi:hypothetical protein